MSAKAFLYKSLVICLLIFLLTGQALAYHPIITQHDAPLQEQPDQDEDGVPDDEDECPEEKGEEENAGCPLPVVEEAPPAPVVEEAPPAPVVEEAPPAPVVEEAPPAPEPVTVIMVQQKSQNNTDLSALVPTDPEQSSGFSITEPVTEPEPVTEEAVEPELVTEEAVEPEPVTEEAVEPEPVTEEAVEPEPVTEEAVDELDTEEALALIEEAAENDINLMVEVDGEVVSLESLGEEGVADLFTGSDPYFTINGVTYGYTNGVCPPIVLPANCTVVGGNAVQAAIDALVARGALANNTYTVTVETGTYAGALNINNVNVPNFSLVLNGAQAGVNASVRNAPGPATESILDGAVTITVPNITINGFTIQNAGGTAITLDPAANGVSILNNIIRNSPLGINTAGADSVTISQNSFRDNTVSGDVSVAANSNNTNISNNQFANGSTAAVTARDSSNVTVANNQITKNNLVQDAITFINISNGNISGNTVTFTGASNNDAIDITSDTTTTGTTTIAGNTLDGNAAGTGSGVQLTELGASPQTINITGNDISGFGDGIQADGVSHNIGTLTGNNIYQNSGLGINNQTAQALNASGNWWGCATGPGTAGCNSAGGASAVTTTGFLTAPAPVTTGATTTTPTTTTTTTTTPASTEPPRVTNNPAFVIFRLPDFNLDIYLVDSQSRGNFFAKVLAADLARFIQANPGATEAAPATFRTITDSAGNAIRLTYLGSNRWRAEFFRGSVLIQQDVFQTDPILGFATISGTTSTTTTTQRTSAGGTTTQTTAQTGSTQPLLLNLTQTFSVLDVPFEFKFPANWVFTFSQGSISIAENQADLAAEADRINSTQPTGNTITLNAMPLQLLGLSPTSTFSDIESYIFNLNALSVEQTLEVPVMMHRSVTFTGLRADGRHGLTTFWVQNGSLVIFSLNTPNATTTDQLTFSWGQILSSLRPAGALPLGAAVDVPNAGIRFSFPLNWDITQTSDPFTVEDQVSGSKVFTFAAPVTDFVSNRNAALETVTDSVIASLNIPSVALREEMVIFNAPALAFIGQTTDGVWMRGLVTVGDGQVFLFIQSAPSKESLDSLEPTWITMLQTIQLLAAL